MRSRNAAPLPGHGDSPTPPRAPGEKVRFEPVLGALGRGSNFPRDITDGATPDPGTPQRCAPLFSTSKVSNYPKTRSPCERRQLESRTGTHIPFPSRRSTVWPPLLFAKGRATGVYPKAVGNRAQSLDFEAILWLWERVLAGHDSCGGDCGCNGGVGVVAKE